MIDEGLTIGELAEKSGVTVRTLHYYDRIGLLVPSARTAANHRRYADEDVQRLYRVVALRQLGLSLSHIAGVLADEQPIADLLQRQLDETTCSIQAHHDLLARLKRGVAAANLRAEELFDVIGGTVELSINEVDGPLRPHDASPAAFFSMLFEGLDGTHTVMRRRLAALNDETMPTAGQALFRSVKFEDSYVMTVLQAKPSVFDDQGWSSRFGLTAMVPGVGLPEGVPADVLRGYAEATFAATTAYVTTIDEAELNRDIPGPGDSALSWSMKVSELLAQVAAYSYHHTGQVSAMTGAAYH
jgi:DNA-binding transcriptional MerR regulator